jgi:hypothetical protein
MKREYQEVMDMIQMPKDCEARILAALEENKKRLPCRVGRVLLTAAVIFAMLTSAVALSSQLREYIFGAAGPFAPYVRPAESRVVTEDGYELRVDSVIADHYLIVGYLEIKDLEGNRLQEGMDIWAHFDQTGPDNPGISSSVFGGEIIRCEADGKSALAAVMEWGGQSVGDPNMTLRIVKPMECKIPVTLEYVPIQTIDLSGLDTGGVLPPLDRLELSPLGINAVTQYKEDASFENTRDHDKLRGALTVHFEDGSTRVSVRDSLGGSFRLATGSWLFMDPYNLVQPEDVEPLDVEQIVGISCQDWYLPIENGAAGPLR